MTKRLAVLNAKLEALASTDELTGLLNRRSGITRLDEEWRQAVRYDLPLACAMIDIDNFKRINDTQGHVGGDVVLRNVGAVSAPPAGYRYRHPSRGRRISGGHAAPDRKFRRLGRRALSRGGRSWVRRHDDQRWSRRPFSRIGDALADSPPRRRRALRRQARGKNCVQQASEVLRQPHAA